MNSTPKILNLLSLGAGVQSTTLALMAEHGEIAPALDGAIFADTGNEPKRVYTHLEWLIKQLSYPVHIVSAGVLADDQLKTRVSKKTGQRYTRPLIPAFITGGGFLGRKCTAEYKVRPITRKARQLAGIYRKRAEGLRVIQWLGISLDEIERMKTSVDSWQKFRHPLIEKKMTRDDCYRWMVQHGYPKPPRSACLFCPFHSDKEWQKIKQNPAEWDEVLAFEKQLQASCATAEGTARLNGVPFLHAKRIPLDQVELKPDDKGGQVDMFREECAGLCGV